MPILKKSIPQFTPASVLWKCLVILTVLFLICSCKLRKEPKQELATEVVLPDEEKTTKALTQLIQRALEEKYPTGTTKRFNQAKSIGCVKANFEVKLNLPDDLKVGVFKHPKNYTSWIRFANASSQSDTKKDFRGMSIKLIGIPGEKLLNDEDTQDFVLNSHTVLFVKDTKDFYKFIDVSLRSNPIWFFLNPFDLHLKELGIVLSGRQHHPSHLDIRYWSTTPYLFGEGEAVKYSVRPCSPSARKLPDPLTDNYLRETMKQQLSNEEACFDFMVQFQTDSEIMPIEDATADWDETLSPFRKVATIKIPSQNFDSKQQMDFCENLTFNPWHSLADHRPLGNINRARKAIYSELAEFINEIK